MSKAQLTFVIYVMHQLSEAWRMPVPLVYARLQKLGILDGYLIAFYDVLHFNILSVAFLTS